ncbi:Fatty acid desaturase 5 isoform 3 [Theobroma cacao]|uniref:Fatty acid desaturase 5 isoform 3 n=1 Tax=Theobroma cacao TaxID=3641 RepID=A0A061G9J1_THECC|nr:Fatty acid desaturase 5 isoform 3 [Theobroma cacao]
MALITSLLSKPKSLAVSPPQRATTIKTRSCSCKVLNFGHQNPKFNQINGEQSPLQASFITRLNRSYSNRKVLALANGVSVGANEPDPEGKTSGRILLSNVVVQRKKEVFWGRKWNTLDMATAGVVVGMHLLSLFAPFHFNWPAFWLAVGLYGVTGLLGITLSFHRNLSHRSFKVPKWLEYFFAYCGVQALQGNPIDWVSTHRYHHQFCDSDRDPHSPIEGFWFSHMSWLFDTDTVVERVTLSLSFSNMQALTYAQNELIFLMFCINGTFAVWRTNQCWGSTAAALLQVSSGYLHSSSNCTWSFAICSRRVSLPCLGNGCEDCMGLPHHLAGKFSMPCVGEASMEYW